MPVTNKKAFSISIMICVTAPPPKRPAAPYDRPMRPDATAAKRSAASRSRPLETAMGRPSAETTTASDTPGMWSTKCSTSQLTFRAAALRSLMGIPLIGCAGGDRLLDSCSLPASGVLGQHLADLFRRPAGAGGGALGLGAGDGPG